MKKCLCGGRLSYSDSIELKFHKYGKISSVVVPGKTCQDCGRKFVVINAIKKEFDF